MRIESFTVSFFRPLREHFTFSTTRTCVKTWLWSSVSWKAKKTGSVFNVVAERHAELLVAEEALFNKIDEGNNLWWCRSRSWGTWKTSKCRAGSVKDRRKREISTGIFRSIGGLPTWSNRTVERLLSSHSVFKSNFGNHFTQPNGSRVFPLLLQC